MSGRDIQKLRKRILSQPLLHAGRADGIPRALVSMLISDNSLSVILQIIFSLANYLKEC